MIENDEINEMRALLLLSLKHEEKALTELIHKDTEIAELKLKLAKYEKRWEKIKNILLLKLLLKSRNYLKGLK